MMGAMNLTPDQAGKLFDLKEKFRNDTAEARKQMMVKHAELAALWKAEKPDQAAITAKQKELNALRDQMQEKRTAFMLEARKIAPELAQGFGRGMGWRHGPRRRHGCRRLSRGRTLRRPGPGCPGQVKDLPSQLNPPPGGEGCCNRPLTFFYPPGPLGPRLGPRRFPVVSTHKFVLP